MKKALYLAFSDRSIMNRIASNADFSSLRSRNLPSRVNFLRSLGCFGAQGYWFSHPLDGEKMTQFLERLTKKKLF